MSPLNLNNKNNIVLLLQGGGALGAYQVGAYRALAERCSVDWVGGISIGSINAAVIASHPHPNAVQELESLWDEILSPSFPPFDYTGVLDAWQPWLPPTRLHSLEAKYADWSWMAFSPVGQLHFFSSRVLNPLENPWFQEWFRNLGRSELGFYDTQPLRETLQRHVDWKALSQPGATRLSLGAARVCDGEVEFFDSKDTCITVDHVMASCALPPAFPPIAVQGIWYFDGGVSNNTPIEVLHDKICRDATKETIVFLIDLWDRKTNELPETLDDVVWRLKSIQYGSRKKAAENVIRLHQEKAARARDSAGRLKICQVMLETDHRDPQFSFSDADFSRHTFDRLNRQGYQDMQNAIDHAERVPHISGAHAELYRFGTLHKHHDTDQRLAV